MRRIAVPVLLVLVCFLAAAGPTPAADAARPTQGWLGIFLDSPGDEPPPSADGDESAIRGVRVRMVVEGSPAEGKLRGSDRILAVDGTAVSSPSELTARLRAMEPGRSVSLTVLRRGRESELGLRVGERPERTDSLRAVAGWIGVEGMALPTSLRLHFGAPANAGVLVSAVAEGSPGEAAGIRVGDVVYEAAGSPVVGSSSLTRLVTEAGVDNPVEVVLARDGVRIVVEPIVERNPAR